MIDNSRKNYDPIAMLCLQVESLKGEGENDQHEEASKQVEEVNGIVDKSKTKSESGDGEIDIEAEEIIKELKNVKRQNCITHWLLSAMIVLTVAWQISEVSLILKVKDGLSHPFKHLGCMFTGVLKTSGTNGHDVANKENKSEAPSLVPLPELPHIELPDLNGNGGKHRHHA